LEINLTLAYRYGFHTNKTAAGLAGGLAGVYGGELAITPDLDGVPALAEERAVLWKRLSDASFISEDEARGLAGLEAST